MKSPHALFEISWEVCNKVGGIHTVLSSKAKTAVARFGDDYVVVGPWLLSDTDRRNAFEPEPGHEVFADACRALGLPVQIGRWKIPGRPRCILIEFSSHYAQKNDILTRLWEDWQVDSIEGGWDYVEPVLFGWAAGKVLEEYWEHYLAPEHRRAVVQAHEWMTGSALLYLKKRVPALGTVFTTHATMLGRALSSLGHSPEDGLGDKTVDDLARTHGVRAKHSLEGVCAREADVFTTVSELTAKEAKLLHRRDANPVLPNGIDLEVLDELAGNASHRTMVRQRLTDLAQRFLGTPDLRNAAFACISGRYEFHNKGIDILLDAAARLEKREGRPVVLWVLVPAGNSGLRSEVRERLDAKGPLQVQDPIGTCTHHLFDEDKDPVRKRAIELGLTNASGARIKLIHVPIYLGPRDDFLGFEYEAVLAAMDLGIFPSFYEPWGYTPQESLGVGVPTITSDFAGFGRWALSQALAEADGVTVVRRAGARYDQAIERVTDAIATALARTESEHRALQPRCRAAAARTAWHDLYENYVTAYSSADLAVDSRAAARVPQTRRPKSQVVVVPASTAAPRIRYFDVAATLPDALQPLERIARNFWWCWDPEAPTLFEAISPQGFAAAGRNPLRFLRRAFPEDLRQKADDASFVARVVAVEQRFDTYLAARRERVELGGPNGGNLTRHHPVAYFCAEFGIHESFPIYSGGLGILAGDHLKSASDLDIPLVGVGLFYRFGYLKQQLTTDGRQLALDRENDPEQLPMELLRNPDGSPLEVRVPMPGRDVALRAWLVKVGRVDLYLLDANTPSNRDEDRDITRHLYGGDHEMRIRQLIALGRGGVRLLGELGIEPAAWHMNEGHAAFLTLERVGRLVRRGGLTFETAREAVRATTAFTTHTPVPAGHDRFAEDIMRRYFSDVPDWVGVPWDRFLRFGRADASGSDFNMTYLALTFSSFCNGVSKLHGIASRDLLHPYWPSLLRDEVPVESITNGVHLPTWTSPRIASLLGARNVPVKGQNFRDGAPRVDRRALWRARNELKRVLRDKVSARVEKAFVGRSDNPTILGKTLAGLDENALWIGFARRFAPYKRAGLLYKDPARLKRLCASTDRPVRILVAGKAHPRDQMGQDILRGIAELARGDQLLGNVVFIEDYDIELARALVQGVDVWLNTPTRMLEASGTSGMKVAANGGLNLSIADGWWPEIADGRNGWVIGSEKRSYAQAELQDQLDAETLYRLLEDEVVPLFFDRDQDGVPAGWLDRVVHSLESVAPVFDTDRMVKEYFDRAYAELGRGFAAMQSDRGRAQRIADEAQRVRKSFEAIKILEVRHTETTDVRVGDAVDAFVRVDLGALTAKDVDVELVLGNATESGELANTTLVVLKPTGTPEGAVQDFAGQHTVTRSGRYGAGLRVRPKRFSASPSSLRDLVLWA
ncbi:MAG: alpha-glucan family phosphorylase [Planctomycetes bacterium]|nr:alpha-glucan family phosphorylase [Planctomycetota bacterium]